MAPTLEVDWVDREQLREAIAAQESLRGSVSDEVVTVTIAALRAQLDATETTTPSRDRRRQVTVVFADVAGFTGLSESMDPELVAGLMNELWAPVDLVIQQHGGWVDKHIGDAVMGVWGIETSREDDPERAVRAALDVRDAFEAFRLRNRLAVDLRIGVNTGPVLAGRVGTMGEVSVTGDAVNVASRVEHAAPHGSVLITHDTYRQVRGVFDVRPLPPLVVRGKSMTLDTYVVERAKPRAFRLPTRGVEGVETRMIGRDVQLAALQTAYQAMRGRGRTSLMTVVGEAGTGKSRLLDEFAAWLELRPEAIYYMKGRSFPDLENVPRGLLREAFAYRFNIFEDDARPIVLAKLFAGMPALNERESAIVGHWLGFDLADSAAVQDLAGSQEFGSLALAHLTRHLRGVTDDAPAVMLLEDIHWADQESLEAVAHLVEELPSASLMILCAARPVLAERHPEWCARSGTQTAMHLDPLDRSETQKLAFEILRRVDDLPQPLTDLLVDTAEGNPLHLEELIKVLIDDGVVDTNEETWFVKSDRLERLAVPPTLAAVLQARLDSLPAQQRIVMQHASVLGRVFWDDAVVTLMIDTGADSVPSPPIAGALDDICIRELIFPHERSIFSDCREFQFKHALLRDATYDTVLLKDRRRLHAAAATWLRARAADRFDEHLVPLAEHLSRCGDYLGAAELLERAAARVAATGALSAACALFERAIQLRGEAACDHTLEATRSRVEVGELHRKIGRLREAVRELSIATRDARACGGEGVPVLALALTRLAKVAIDHGKWNQARRLLARAKPLAESTGGSVDAAFLVTQTSLRLSTDDPEPAFAAAREALKRIRKVADADLEREALNDAARAAARTGRFDDSARYLDEALNSARRVGNIEREAMLLGNLGALAHMRAASGNPGRLGEAIELYGQALRLLEEVGSQAEVAQVMVNLAQAQTEAGRVDDATRHANKALRIASDRGLVAVQAVAVVVHGQIAIVRGERAVGLALIGSVCADSRSHRLEEEVGRILNVHGIRLDDAEAAMSAGATRDLTQAVEHLLGAASDERRRL